MLAKYQPKRENPAETDAVRAQGIGSDAGPAVRHGTLPGTWNACDEAYTTSGEGLMARNKESMEKIADAVSDAVQVVATGVGLAPEPKPEPQPY